MNLDFYNRPPRVRANLVQSLGGAFEDSTGSSRGISNELDRDLLLHLRTLADVVVTDGETARRENYRVPKACDLAVITRIGYSPVVGESTRKYLEFIGHSPAAVIRELLSEGYSRILLETGPNLVRELVGQNLVNQLCMTNTNGSIPVLEQLGVQDWVEEFSLTIGDTRFGAWAQIPR